MRHIVTQALEMTMNNISTSGGLSIIDTAYKMNQQILVLG